MTADERRLQRLRRLERLRAITKRQLAAETAQAEGVLAQLRALGDRTRRLAEDYADCGEVCDGYALTQVSQFAAGLSRIVHSTGQEAKTAEHRADHKAAELASAERRRAAVEDRLELERRSIIRRGQSHPAGARRKFGTELD